MLMNEYNTESQFRKSSKDVKFWQCSNLQGPFVKSRIDVEN